MPEVNLSNLGGSRKMPPLLVDLTSSPEESQDEQRMPEKKAAAAPAPLRQPHNTSAQTQQSRNQNSILNHNQSHDSSHNLKSQNQFSRPQPQPRPQPQTQHTSRSQSQPQSRSLSQTLPHRLPSHSSRSSHSHSQSPPQHRGGAVNAAGAAGAAAQKDRTTQRQRARDEVHPYRSSTLTKERLHLGADVVTKGTPAAPSPSTRVIVLDSSSSSSSSGSSSGLSPGVSKSTFPSSSSGSTAVKEPAKVADADGSSVTNPIMIPARLKNEPSAAKASKTPPRSATARSASTAQSPSRDLRDSRDVNGNSRKPAPIVISDNEEKAGDNVTVAIPVASTPSSSRTAPTPTAVTPVVQPQDAPAGAAGSAAQVEEADQPIPAPRAAPETPAAAAVATPRREEWDSYKIESRLHEMVQEVRKTHAKLVDFSLRRRIAKLRDISRFTEGNPEPDPFAAMKPMVVDREEEGATDCVMKVKARQHGTYHGKNRTDFRVHVCRMITIKTDKVAVPKYRFHHVEITKNILTPNTMLKFIPHIRDMEASEEKTFNMWVNELQDMDRKSGFSTLQKGERVTKVKRDELAATLSLELERWLRKLAIPGCTKTTLIRYMASLTQEEDDSFTPQQKSSLRKLTRPQEEADEGSAKNAKAFTDAFNRVFKATLTLRDVLSLDEQVEQLTETKTRAKETPGPHKEEGASSPEEPLIDQVEDFIASYSTLGCLICFNHSCEHGEYMFDNHRKAYSVDNLGGLRNLLKQRRIDALREKQRQEREHSSALAGARPRKDHNASNLSSQEVCKNKCFMRYDIGNDCHIVDEWSEKEIKLLKSSFLVMNSVGIIPQCNVAVLLERFCWDVHRKIVELGLKMPEELEPPAEPQPPKPVKPLNWYDRNRKVLLADWKEHTRTHDSTRYEMHDPCNHDGPCSAANGCPCVKLGVMCERFCRCTAETCAYKFTGCACHGSGKTCLARQREGRPCICVQLNRECDPMLCRGCGARERADPENKLNHALHASGCQNVTLQRGLSKPVCLGESQLEFCGYGLYTAVDIAADEFVIEYVGEIIEHDEGVRREARRGNVFDETTNSSYLFTLLEDDGIWVDAAVYGNLSRYINHNANENARKGCNLVPKIVWVNGEFRIRFSALRDIKAGEELFFNYGENFPNLTKKRLEDKADEEEDEALAAAAAGMPSSKSRFANVVDDGEDSDESDEFGVPASRRARKKSSSAAKNKPVKGKRGGARPGAGRKPNLMKQAAAAAAAAAAATGSGSTTSSGAAGVKERKKPGPKPKPRPAERKEAPPPTTSSARDDSRMSEEDDDEEDDDGDIDDDSDEPMEDAGAADGDNGDNDSDSEYPAVARRGRRVATTTTTTTSTSATTSTTTNGAAAATSASTFRKRRFEDSDDDDDYDRAGTAAAAVAEPGADEDGDVNESDENDDDDDDDSDPPVASRARGRGRGRYTRATKRQRTNGPNTDASPAAGPGGRKPSGPQQRNGGGGGRRIVSEADNVDSDEPLTTTTTTATNTASRRAGGASSIHTSHHHQQRRGVYEEVVADDDNDEDDEDEEEDEDGRVTTSGNTTSTSNAARSEVNVRLEPIKDTDDEDEEEDEDDEEEDGDDEEEQEEEEEEEEEEDEGEMDRAKRKTQRPARYRSEEP